jgi:uncharacterized membrane-anchored protein
MSWPRSGKGSGDRKPLVLSADAGYRASMLVAGTLGTVMGDYLAYDRHLGNAIGSVALSVVLDGFFLVGPCGLIWQVPFDWGTVVMVRAAGACVGDYLPAGSGSRAAPLRQGGVRRCVARLAKRTSAGSVSRLGEAS